MEIEDNRKAKRYKFYMVLPGGAFNYDKNLHIKIVPMEISSLDPAQPYAITAVRLCDGAPVVILGNENVETVSAKIVIEA